MGESFRLTDLVTGLAGDLSEEEAFKTAIGTWPKGTTYRRLPEVLHIPKTCHNNDTLSK